MPERILMVGLAFMPGSASRRKRSRKRQSAGAGKTLFPPRLGGRDLAHPADVPVRQIAAERDGRHDESASSEQRTGIEHGVAPHFRAIAEDRTEFAQPRRQHLVTDADQHRALVEASGLDPLASVCDLLQAFFHKYRPILRGVRGSKENHCQIVEALHVGDLDTAAKLLRYHVSHYPANEEDEETAVK